MIDVLRIAHLRIAPQEGNSEVGNCEVHRLSVIGFRLVDFFSEKIIAGPHWVPDPPSLAQMTFAQCTSMSELKIDSGAPPGGQI